MNNVHALFIHEPPRCSYLVDAHTVVILDCCRHYGPELLLHTDLPASQRPPRTIKNALLRFFWQKTNHLNHPDVYLNNWIFLIPFHSLFCLIKTVLSKLPCNKNNLHPRNSTGTWYCIILSFQYYTVGSYSLFTYLCLSKCNTPWT